ncbi:MAG: hypothetical protein A3H29_07150 [Acidobacteria bacterium RIFCSPLOWO2_02_FULL_67_21]|nr:MAG: hypothetical protein A3H29_07150 [Acidobacteria bacterium RIFCSPLOWO2_02_FULL_67_21]
MIAGVRGRLLTSSFIERRLNELPGAAAPPPQVVRALDVWSERRHATLGPASSIRAIGEIAVIPLLKLLGFDIRRRIDEADRTIVHAAAAADVVPVVILQWNAPLDAAWRGAILDGIRADARWCLCCNGASLRLVDAHHTWTRQHLEFDLTLLPYADDVRTLFWTTVRADAFAGRPSLLERAVALSARYGAEVCRALGSGVLEALDTLFGAVAQREPSRSPRALFEQSLTVLYRVLFLLFAEARGLVPVWHPIYRERYTIEGIVTTLLAGGRYSGIWEAVLAISRLAHAGCHTGELQVTAFNGRLFSPAQSSAFDRTRIGDRIMGQAVLALGSTPAAGSRTRISYGDLDVEQLGAVYERVLEYEPAGTDAESKRAAAGASLVRNRDNRQSSGTFYTPRLLTAFLVRHTLEPLVAGRSADDILELRVLDPAMGSGAFLVAACRYLAAAAEASLVRDGRWHSGDVTDGDRTALRRDIAMRCLFGVDVNPMAVQLARLSLWLGTLASDRPLTFLDHHLVAGDSLIGATLDDLVRQPTRTREPRRRAAPTPLYDSLDATPALEQAVRTRLALARQPDESAAIVAGKGRTIEALHAPESPLGRWSSVLDLWCAGWFWEAATPLTAGVFGELRDRLLGRGGSLPARVAEPLLEHSRAAAARHSFLHWPLAFPEVFSDEEGARLASPGFDAVIGNPPWDMVRGDSGDETVRAGRRLTAHQFTGFVREAGVYRLDARSHLNRYQLFVERALQLVKKGGRIGLVLPSGVLADAGAAALRRHLFDRARIDSITGLDNRRRFFPIHRSLRFAVLTCTAGQPTDTVACRFGVTRGEDLERDARPLLISRPLLSRISGPDDLGIPELATEHDLRIVEATSGSIPCAGAPEGWGLEFGRELNATDDRGLFRPFRGRGDVRPVLEGKQIQPFRSEVNACRYEVAAGSAPHIPRRARVAYRDVASATNRLTLIAAVVPARVVTTHTLFCLKSTLSADAQQVVCALLNSFVANYLIRLRVNTHVTTALVSRLPLPFLDARHPWFARIARLARALMRGREPVDDMTEYPELQAIVAHLYAIGSADFEHILGTFPLIPVAVKETALRRLSALR